MYLEILIKSYLRHINMIVENDTILDTFLVLTFIG